MARNSNGFGPTTQKVLLLLTAGLVLGLSRSPRQYFRIIDSVKKDWKGIEDRALRNSIRNLYKTKLIDAVDMTDGSTNLVLSEKGKTLDLRYQIDEMTVPEMKTWDRKWRIVIFDIPEKKKKSRDALSGTLKRMGFLQLQKSVFIHPFNCNKEIEFIIEFFGLRQYVRMIIAESLDNEIHLKKQFGLK